MPIRIKPVGARGGPRGAMEASRSKAKNKKTIESLAKKMAKAADPTGRISDQDLSRALSMVRGMLKPQAKKAGGKVKKAKGMARGGKTSMKSKGMAKGGKMKSKGMAKGGKMKSKGMAKGGKMKSKGMKRGGKAKR